MALGGTYENLLKREGGGSRKPPLVVTLPLSAWADEQTDKPSGPIPIGLRLPADDDAEVSQDEANKTADTFAAHGDYDDRVRAYNAALVREMVARCTCQAVDVTLPFFECGALDVRRRLTTDGITRLWQELEVLRSASDPSMPEIEPVEGFAHLLVMYDRGVAWDFMPREEQKKCRRLLETVRQLMQEGEARAEAAGVDPLLAASG